MTVQVNFLNDLQCVMEDRLSVKSNESLATSDEFDFVPEKPSSSKTPTLNIISGGFNELKNTMTEVIKESEGQPTSILDSDARKVGHSRFYSQVELGADPLSVYNQLSPTEKKDVMKPEPDCSDEEGKICSFHATSHLYS